MKYSNTTPSKCGKNITNKEEIIPCADDMAWSFISSKLPGISKQSPNISHENYII